MQAKTILESSIDSIITIDEHGVILSFNHAAETLFGYSRDEVLGENFKILLPERNEELHDEFLTKINLGESPPLSGKREELVGLHKKGQSLPIELSVTRTEFNHKIRYTGIITDITERKINEQLKRDFISTVSHELRTPLTSINGAVKLLKAQSGVVDQEQSAAMLDVTSRNIDRLSELINDLLDFEKLDSSGMVYEKETINLNTLASTVIEQTRNISEQAKISLAVNLECENEFIADPKRISQVLVNLISNAIKFSPEESTVEVGCKTEAEMIKLYVKDSGKGIPDEFKLQIFERFTQVDSTDNRQIQRGTGLGLAISKRMIEDMGGTIGFDSIEGQGSTFFVIFPIV